MLAFQLNWYPFIVQTLYWNSIPWEATSAHIRLFGKLALIHPQILYLAYSEICSRNFYTVLFREYRCCKEVEISAGKLKSGGKKWGGRKNWWPRFGRILPKQKNCATKLLHFSNFYLNMRHWECSLHPSLQAMNRLFSSHTFCAVCIFTREYLFIE